MSDPQVLAAWSGLRLTEVRELVPGRVWELADKRASRYALKPIFDQPWVDATSRFVAEARILSYLSQRGLPVAPPVICDDGRIYAMDGDGVGYFLTPMLPVGGTGESESAELLHDIGGTLARLHVAFADCPFEIPAWEINAASFAAVWQRITVEIANIDELVTLVEPWLDRIAIATDDPHRQLVHGDAHGANILTDGHSVTGIIDMDHMPIAPRTYDVAYFFAFGINWPYKNNREPVARDIAFMTRNVLAGYGTLTAAELDQIPALTLSVALGLLHYFRDDERHIQEWWINTARWIVQHSDTLIQ